MQSGELSAHISQERLSDVLLTSVARVYAPVYGHVMTVVVIDCHTQPQQLHVAACSQELTTPTLSNSHAFACALVITSESSAGISLGLANSEFVCLSKLILVKGPGGWRPNETGRSRCQYPSHTSKFSLRSGRPSISLSASGLKSFIPKGVFFDDTFSWVASLWARERIPRLLRYEYGRRGCGPGGPDVISRPTLSTSGAPVG